MSRRLSTRCSRRSAPSSMAATSSAWSSLDHSMSSERREETDALSPARGVRSSWLTAASRAVRMRLPSASSLAWSASDCRRWRSRTTAAWAANAARMRRSSAGSTQPVSASATWSPTGTSTAASSGRSSSRSRPTRPAHVHGATSLSRSSSATDSMPKVSRTRSSSASILVSPRSRLPARKERISDSARSRAAWWVHRAARSTTEATDTATAKDHESEDVLGVGDRDAVHRRGEVPVQQYRAEAAETSAGISPPSRAAAAVNVGNNSMSFARAEVRGDAGQQQGQQHRAADTRQAAPDEAGAAEPRAPGYREAASLARLVVRDEVGGRGPRVNWPAQQAC